MSDFLREYRCKNCNKLFFKGDLMHRTIEVKCRKCKKFNKIRGSDCKLLLLFDQQNSYKRTDGTFLSKGEAVNQALGQCSKCKEIENCGYYKMIKKDNICPFCKRGVA